MGGKKEERERRRALKLEKFEAAKEALIHKVTADKTPKLSQEPLLNPSPRMAPHLERSLAAENDKMPKAEFEGSRYKFNVTWCITRADKNDSWSWGESRTWSDAEWESDINPSFINFAGLTWADVDKFSSESGHKMHHSQDLSELVQEAQDRWKALGLEEFDDIFRFRLGGTKRAWGYVVQAHFHFVWWERNHKIYPV